MFTVEAVHKKNHQVSEMLSISSYAGLHFQYKQGNLQKIQVTQNPFQDYFKYNKYP